MANRDIRKRYEEHKQDYIDAGRHFISYLRYDPETRNGSWEFIKLDHDVFPSSALVNAFHREAAGFAIVGQLADYTHHIPSGRRGPSCSTTGK